MNPMDFMKQVTDFRQRFSRQNPGVNPQEYVQKLMNQGKVSQQQFEQARQYANMLGYKI